jgi:hypothetical protein
MQYRSSRKAAIGRVRVRINTHRMSYPLQELRAASDAELIERHDRLAQNTSVGVNYYLEELARRESYRQGERVRELTQTVVNLTWIIAALTAVNVAAVLIDVL